MDKLGSTLNELVKAKEELRELKTRLWELKVLIQDIVWINECEEPYSKEFIDDFVKCCIDPYINNKMTVKEKKGKITRE